MKDEARTLWNWMLTKSLLAMAFIINAISFILVSITMFFVDWFTKH